MKLIERSEQSEIKTICFRISKEMKLKCNIICARRDIQLSEFIREALIEHVSKQKSFLI